MSDQPHNTNQESEEPYRPAHPVKRILAWMGIVYMAILVLLNLYPFFYEGRALTGVAPLLVCPGAAGMAAISLYQIRHTSSRGVQIALVLLIIACLGVIGVGLWDGIPALIQGWGA